MANFGDFQVQILIQKTSRKEFILPTINQLVRKERKKVIKKSKSPALVSCPQRRGVCTRVYTTIQKSQTQHLEKWQKLDLQVGLRLLLYWR